ncbi:PPE domain-containing protein [Umezawaea beigongshangensis]|uniref:PPE domain-containing protein n=1 Tax=Umezawaea beigongshangensis TaxID=2780383 RepID=UPI0018F23208|nr:hypothetical protein [Umezawaea beigongshangensis]
MSGFVDIKDFRFEGYDNPSLAQLVQKFDTSDAAQKFGEASHALRTLAKSLTQVDQALRDELGKLGIAWQGNAGDNAGKSVTVSADYADETQASSKQNAQATMMQSNSHSQAKNGMPPSQTLRGPSETSTIDDFADFFGVETDHAAEVKETNAARQQTIDGLNGYAQNSRDAINDFEVPGKPPTFDVTAASSTTSISSASVTSPSAVSVPGGANSLSGGGTFTGLPGGGGFSGVNVPGGGNGLGNVPGGGNGLGGGNLPGGGNNTGLPIPPGNSTGVNPLSPTTSALPPAASMLPKGGGSNLPLGLGLAGAGALGLGAAAATARGARIVRGGAGGGGAAAGGGGAAPAGKAPASTGTGTGTGTAAKAGAAVTGVVGEENAQRTGPGAKGGAGRAGAGASGVMQPAASGRGAPGEEDEEHVRKYGVESDEVFGDERLVVQSVIGDEDGPRQKDDPVR